ncbi:MAG: DUF1566 domain-containing protein [Sulfurovum sp.]|nr:DUF1566 domain-containing protein [Sulfurovum sp.]
MKKRIVFLGLWLATGGLMAGGNFETTLPEVAGIDEIKSCTINTVYTEKDAGLMWQDAKYTDAEDGAYKRNHSTRKAGTWEHAINYCRGLNYEGYTDWRLPTSDELTHMHRKPGQEFINYRDGDFWTSTPTTDVRYYVVFPADAYQYKRYKRESNYIRCVRCLRK